MYQPWVGIVLSLFISGSSQFLAGKRIQGIVWFVALPLLAIASGWCLASPLVSGDLLGFILLAASTVLWIVMLVKSHQSLPRLHWSGWVCFILLFLLFVTFNPRFVRPFMMPTSSMSPTIQKGDRVMVEEYAYWFGEPQRGDIIVFKTDGISSMVPQNEFYAKRIVGIPSDVLSIQNGHLYNHGQILSGPAGLAKLEFVALIANPIYLTNSLDTYKISDGSYFVIGDNTTNSFDSRYFGPIPGKNIIGRISKIYWPFDRAGKIQ